MEVGRRGNKRLQAAAEVADARRMQKFALIMAGLTVVFIFLAVFKDRLFK